jgi:predicted dithiol-disulfide oxidoreductase (DUF899 family)
VWRSREETVIESPQRYHHEPPGYRRARNELLAAEPDARRAVERAASLRRSLPLGGEIPEDYVFQDAGGDGVIRPVRLSGLFGPGQDTLALYSFMFGPEMGKTCPSCSSFPQAPRSVGVAAGVLAGLVAEHGVRGRGLLARPFLSASCLEH